VTTKAEYVLVGTGFKGEHPKCFGCINSVRPAIWVALSSLKGAARSFCLEIGPAGHLEKVEILGSREENGDIVVKTVRKELRLCSDGKAFWGQNEITVMTRDWQ
jgi:hypothetical protein